MVSKFLSFVSSQFSPGARRLSGRVEFLWIAGIALFGCGIRLGQYWKDPLIGRDAIFYLQKMTLWLQGDPSVAAEHYNASMLFLHLIAWCTKLGFSPEAAGVALNLAAGTALIVASYFLAREVFDLPVIGLCVAWLVATNPILVGLSHEIQRETPYLLAAVIALFFLFRGVSSEKGRDVFFCGLFIYIAMALRYESVELLLWAAVVVFCRYEWKICGRGMRLLFWTGCGWVCGLGILLAGGIAPSFMWGGVYGPGIVVEQIDFLTTGSHVGRHP
jgi:hypothetical protein